MKTSVIDLGGIKKIDFNPFVDFRGDLLKLYRRQIFLDLFPTIEEVYISQSKKGAVR